MKTLALSLVVLLSLVVPGIMASDNAVNLSDHDRAVAIVARYLLESIGTPALNEAVLTRAIRSEAYWDAVFRAARWPDGRAFIWKDLSLSLNSVPLVNGEPAKPDVYAKAVMRGLGTMPLVTVGDLSPEEAKRLEAFAQGPLFHFADVVEHSSPEIETVGAELVKAAQSTFGSVAIANDFHRLAVFAADLGESAVDVVDVKERLNEALHVFGLHLFIEGDDLTHGRLNLTSYLVLNKYVYSLFNAPFVIYEVRPSVEDHSTAVLGHAETDQGYLFLFANHVDDEVQAAWDFLAGRTIGWLWWQDDGAVKPIPGLSADDAQAIDSAARAAFKKAAGSDLTKERYRRLLIDTIGHHEGFHQHIEATLAEATRRGRINEERKSVLHEAGAYLYQLETSDPAFVPMSLMMIVATGANPSLPQGPNAEGCRLLLSYLQRYVRDARFWNSDDQLPVGPGLVALLTHSSADIQKAAGQARWDLDVELQGQ